MIARVYSACAMGVECCEVDVEVDISNGLPSFSVVGLPDTAIRESRDRIKAAIKNTGYKFPDKKITVNLAPADIKKEGAGFDLPIAIGILAANETAPLSKIRDFVICGQLSLNGDLKPIKGALPVTMNIDKARSIVLPRGNAKEAGIVQNTDVYTFTHLKETIEFLNGNLDAKPKSTDLHGLFRENSSYPVDFNDVKGQEHVKRGLEIAASGGHNVLPMGTQYDRQIGRLNNYVHNVIGHWTQRHIQRGMTI